MTTTRSAIHTFAAVFTATAVLTGCKPADKPAAPPPPPAAEAGGWQAVVTNFGYAIVFKEAGQDRLRLACAPQPARFMVWVGGFNPVASEERLSVGFDDNVTALVAKSTAPGPGVDAEGQIHMAEIMTLKGAKTVGVSYGAQTLSVAAPAPALSDAFEESCRQTAEDEAPRSAAENAADAAAAANN